MPACSLRESGRRRGQRSSECRHPAGTGCMRLHRYAGQSAPLLQRCQRSSTGGCATAAALRKRSDQLLRGRHVKLNVLQPVIYMTVSDDQRQWQSESHAGGEGAAHALASAHSNSANNFEKRPRHHAML